MSVRFEPPKRTSAFRKSVSLEFESQDVPVVQLTLIGQVLEPLVLSPERVNLRDLLESQVEAGSFLVSNTTEEIWERIDVESNVSWLKTLGIEPQSIVKSDKINQQWKVLYEVDVTGLEIGMHLGEMVVSKGNSS